MSASVFYKPLIVAGIAAALFTTAFTMPPINPHVASQGSVAVVAAPMRSMPSEAHTAAEDQREIRAAIKEQRAEAVRLAQEAEAARIAAEIEAQRVAAEAEAARVAAEIQAQSIAAEAEAQRLVEEEAARVAAEAEAQRLAMEAEAQRVAEVDAARITAKIEAPRLAAEATEAIGRAQDSESLRISSRTRPVQPPITITVNTKGNQAAIDACTGPVLYSGIPYLHLITEHDGCGGWNRFGWLQEGQVVNLVGNAPTLKTGSYKATQFVEVPRSNQRAPFVAFDGMPAVILQVCVPDALTRGLPLRTLLIGLDPA